MKNWPELKPYQEELLKGLRKGALTHIHMSRGTGKSMLTANVLNAAFEDIAAKEENKKWDTTKRYAKNVIRLWDSVVALGPKL